MGIKVRCKRVYRTDFLIRNHKTTLRSKMKIGAQFGLLVAISAAVIAPSLAQNGTVASNNAVNLGMDMFLEFMNATGGYLGCCPDIVLGPKGSVIQPFTGYRGNVAIIVNWGNPCPYRPWRRPCTINDHGFIWYVDWGDYSHSFGTQDHLGPFQVAHQYAKYINTYGVTVYYCSDPGSPRQRCCDSLYRTIDVSYDPQHPYPPHIFKEGLN